MARQAPLSHFALLCFWGWLGASATSLKMTCTGRSLGCQSLSMLIDGNRGDEAGSACSVVSGARRGRVPSLRSGGGCSMMDRVELSPLRLRGGMVKKSKKEGDAKVDEDKDEDEVFKEQRKTKDEGLTGEVAKGAKGQSKRSKSQPKGEGGGMGMEKLKASEQWWGETEKDVQRDQEKKKESEGGKALVEGRISVEVPADSFDSDCSETGDAIDENQYQDDEKDGEQNETDGGESSSEGPSGGEEEPISQTLSSSQDSLDGEEIDREKFIERVRNQPCRGSSTFAGECAKSDAMQLKDEADFEARDAEESRIKAELRSKGYSESKVRRDEGSGGGGEKSAEDEKKKRKKEEKKEKRRAKKRRQAAGGQSGDAGGEGGEKKKKKRY